MRLSQAWRLNIRLSAVVPWMLRLRTDGNYQIRAMLTTHTIDVVVVIVVVSFISEPETKGP
ncbi:hypothetical protein ASPFODRAFT_564214 [Aspergillus luchuensis CBS 106.47]|uniref:Uncharacterized protein n=1 Tax=Aspergillus luchuensis (strain CBS 106.47) TaxID=1137211 RepID=A0A1M3TK60_ASPLC|nr:hypothetical protein ASPFODRAFT_564214 [Aspergillus luchuensis CBS 106.47]